MISRHADDPGDPNAGPSEQFSEEIVGSEGMDNYRYKVLFTRVYLLFLAHGE